MTAALARVWRHRVGAVALAFLLSRSVLLLVSAVAGLVLHRSPLAVWDRWDTVWYLGIAGHGYHWGAPGHQASLHAGSALAFYPLYPLLLHLINQAGFPALAGGIILSNAVFLAALFYLRGLLAQQVGDARAQRAIYLCSVFPTAFYTFAPYTESLFLLGAVATLYHAYRRETVAAAMWLGVAMLTRSTGLILIPPALWLLRDRRGTDWIVLLAPSVSGWIAYVSYLAANHLSFAWLLSAQTAWHRALTFPWIGFTSSVSWLVTYGGRWPGLTAENIFSLAVTLAFLVLTWRAWPLCDTPLRMYMAGFWLLVLCVPEWTDSYAAPFSSVDRFVLALFPLAIWGTKYITGRLERPVMVASIVVMAGLSAMHVAGGWVG